MDKKKQDHTKETFEIENKVTVASPSVNLSVVQGDHKLNFNLHITNICRSPGNQLNALIRLWLFLSFVAKIESLQKRPLRTYITTMNHCKKHF